MKKNKKKIIIVCTNRADFYLQNYLFSKMIKSRKIEPVFIIAMTSKQRKMIKIPKYKNVKIISNPIKESKDMANKSISFLINSFSKFFDKINPDIVLLLGDRYETLSACIAAYTKKIKLAHLHGGEETYGSLDNNYRHSISKMSSIHFVSNIKSKSKLIRMGEHSKTIYNVGSIGIELLKRTLMYKNKLNIIKKYKKNYFIVSMHPCEYDKGSMSNNLKILLNVLKREINYNFIFTSPNGEYGSTEIENLIIKSEKNVKNFYYIKNLGENYPSALKFSSGIIGNSSSGILEAPSLNIPSLNLGSRQFGRIQDKSLVNSNFDFKNIKKSMQTLKKKKIKIKSVYEKKKTSENIIKILENIILK